MIYLYNSKSFNPYHNLAVEDYFIDFANEHENVYILYFWQNANTIVIGRNQDAFSECNVDKLAQYKTFLARRKTGGGAVFHDKNNLNFSFIVPKNNFDKSCSMNIIKNALVKLGFNAEINGRNDILVDGAKCSGNAYLNKQNAVLHHGTILLETDFEIMQKLLNVNKDKLKSKGVKSVKSRVVNLKSIDGNIEVEQVKTAIKSAFETTYKDKCSSFNLPDTDIKVREDFFKDYNWIYGDKKFANIKSYTHKFDWGLCSIKILENDNKKYVKIYSDALDYSAVEQAEKILNNGGFSKKNIDDEIIVEIFEFYNDVLSLQ